MQRRGQVVAHLVDEQQLGAGHAAAVARPPETWTILSASPCTTRAGTCDRLQPGPRSGWVTIATIWRSVPAALTPRS